MMRVKLVIALFILFISQLVWAQKEDDRVLLTIGDEEVTVSEFMYVFNKNNGREGIQDTTSMKDYLDLFINFRLKVLEAERRGMDTLSSFKNELAGYRNQLAQPYLLDKEVNEKLLKEAYDRLQYDIRASHIMKRIPENMDEDDSLAKAAYQELMDIRKRAMKGEDFALLAKEFSDDPSARDQPANRNFPARKGNGGDLGYFTAFYMVYPFENAAYTTPVGEVSMPIRTRYGYHIVKVVDKIDALGTIHVAHILVQNSKNVKVKNQEARKKMNEIRNEISSGKISFEDAAKKYSDDKASAERGGTLNWFEVNKMVPEFIKAISDIDSIGGISYPVETDYGVHLIKLLDLRKVPPYEQYVSELKNKVAKDSRSNKSKEVAVEKFKAKYKFKEYPKALDQFYTVVDSSIFKKSWKAEKASALKKTMFILAKKKYTQKDFAKYVENNQRTQGAGTIKFITHKLYNQWVSNIVLSTRDSHLEDEEFDFRMLVNEYHDGILLFNISDEMVWSKAIKDSVGLADFHDKNKANYTWKKRIDAEVYRAKNDSIAQLVQMYLLKDMPMDSILTRINSNSRLNLGYETGKYERGDNRVIDNIPQKKGVYRHTTNDHLYYIVRVKDVLNPTEKNLDEARGLITADYQNYLHDKWIKDLREKYQVKINNKVFESIENQ